MKINGVVFGIANSKIKSLLLMVLVLLAASFLKQNNAFALSVNYNAPTNTITGTANPSQLVSLSVTGLPLGTVTANSSGVFSYTLSAAQVSTLGISCGKKVSAITNDSLKYFTGVYQGANINYTDLSSPTPSIQYLGGGSGSYPATYGSNSIGFDSSDRYAYIPTSPSSGMGIQIVDTQPATPVVVGTIPGRHVYTSSDGKVLYVSTSSNLLAYDISTTALAVAPVLLSSGPSPAVTFFVAGQVGSFSPTVDLLVGTDSAYNDIHIYSFDRTTNTFTFRATITGVKASHVAGTDIGYSADVSMVIAPDSARTTLMIYNVANPNGPVLTGSLPMPSGVNITSLDLSNAGDFAILSTNNGAYKVNLLNPSSPVIDSSWVPGPPSMDVNALNTSISPTGQYVALNGSIGSVDQFTIKDTITGANLFTGNMGTNATAEWGGWSGNYDQSVVAYDQTGNCSSKLTVEKSRIGIIKDYGSDEYGATFKFSLENNGNVDLTDISAIDDLATILGASNIVSVSTPAVITAPASGSSVNLNSTYNGDSDQELLVLPNNLLIGHKLEFSIDVRFKKSTTVFPVTNKVNVSATAYNVPAVLVGDFEEEFGLPKNAISAVKTVDGDIVSLGGNYHQASFLFNIKNSGDYDLDNVNVSDDLDNIFGAGNYTVENLTIPTTPSSGSSLVINTNYNGSSDINMLNAGSSNLLIGHEATLRLTVKFNGAKVSNKLTNVATASAKGADTAEVLGDMDVTFNIDNTPVVDNTDTTNALPSTGELSFIVKILAGLSSILVVFFLKKELV
jgi:hypothetical protein